MVAQGADAKCLRANTVRHAASRPFGGCEESAAVAQPHHQQIHEIGVGHNVVCSEPHYNSIIGKIRRCGDEARVNVVMRAATNRKAGSLTNRRYQIVRGVI